MVNGRKQASRFRNIRTQLILHARAYYSFVSKNYAEKEEEDEEEEGTSVR